ncbi:MAG: ribonuclease D, partial [Myxococcales bacterium]|nr:ribonuclease D [Myxococcales bacterium]
MSAPRLIDEDAALARVLPELAAAETLALDCEGNGLFAYRARLCCTQFAWFDGGALQVVVIDPFAVELAPLAPILGPEGPRKVLHDLTFDARMLQDAGLELGHVWDTSVAARFLGEEATGLASLAKAHLGVELDKGLQHHDWSQRPLRERELAYLAGDVRHLLGLAEVLERLVMDHGIVEEVRLEVEYKLGTGLAPPKATRPAHERIKGYRKLSPVERSILKSLCETRDE